jgi:hypothetical protein
MLRDTAHRLGSRHHEGDPVVENALLESFTVHARSLLDFFYKSRAKPDDALAADFFRDDSWERRRPPLSDHLGDVNRRVGKEVAHLTYHRETVTQEAKGWAIVPMYLEIAGVFARFVELVPEEMIGREFLEVAIPMMPTGEPVRILTGMPRLGSTPPASIATQAMRPAELDR